MIKKQRIFVAINLPEDIKIELGKFQEKWQDISLKWINPDNLHITLLFLGCLNNEELGEVCMAVKEVVKKHNSFNLNLNKISYGPIGKIPPRMIWVGGEKNKELSLLKNDLEKLLAESVHFVSDKKSFSPHITLARVNSWQWKIIEPEERPEVNENIDLNFIVESIEVMESELKRGGPKYTIIESHNLK